MEQVATMPLNILYVEDDADIRHIVRVALSLDPLIGLEVAASGEEALELLGRRPLPDVALLDVMMPGMDGPTLMGKLREDPATAALPVIFMTAKARPADVADYRARGAIGVILKPFDPLELAAAVRALWETHRRAAASSA